MEKIGVLKGKLGFDGSDVNTLSRATPVVIDTFEDHGHEVYTFASRSTTSVSMELDHYTVELRHRPQMKRGWKSPQSAGDTLELRIQPLYPQICDREISEMLLAAVLHNLVQDLDVISVKWLDSSALLTRNQFLSVFEPVDLSAFDVPDHAKVPNPLFALSEPEPQSEVAATSICDQQVETPAQPPEILTNDTQIVEPVSAAVAAFDRTVQIHHDRPRSHRSRGRDVFAPVEETARELEDHCDEILMATQFDERPQDPASSQLSLQRPPNRTGVPKRMVNWATTGVIATVSAPLAVASGALNLLRSSDLRFSISILMVTATALYLDSAGMVRAAISMLQN